ncbi:hypothetical protein BaRGS_00005698 [Batillaria attramentaria]|uniref:Uncharacterized protein n=1 Tax=Batillaria attramentaria TaxID=370345 RepID=A0ABD0LUA0_9CAEN
MDSKYRRCLINTVHVAHILEVSQWCGCHHLPFASNTDAAEWDSDRSSIAAEIIDGRQCDVRHNSVSYDVVQLVVTRQL